MHPRYDRRPQFLPQDNRTTETDRKQYSKKHNRDDSEYNRRRQKNHCPQNDRQRDHDTLSHRNLPVSIQSTNKCTQFNLLLI